MKNFLLLKGVGSKTIGIYTYGIDKYAEGSKNREGANDVMAYSREVVQTYSPSTQRVVITALNHLCEKSGLNIKIPLPYVTQTFRKWIVGEDEFGHITNNFISHTTYTSTRNREVLKVLGSTGLRASEILSLKWSDISKVYITVTSKNNRTRKVPYYFKLFKDLEEIKRGEYVVTTSRGDQLSYSALGKIFDSVGIKGFSPHTLRHSFATRLLKNGVPINYVSQMLGHSSIDTTLLYLHYDLTDVVKSLAEKDGIKNEAYAPS